MQYESHSIRPKRCGVPIIESSCSKRRIIRLRGWPRWLKSFRKSFISDQERVLQVCAGLAERVCTQKCDKIWILRVRSSAERLLHYFFGDSERNWKSRQRVMWRARRLRQDSQNSSRTFDFYAARNDFKFRNFRIKSFRIKKRFQNSRTTARFGTKSSKVLSQNVSRTVLNLKRVQQSLSRCYRIAPAQHCVTQSTAGVPKFRTASSSNWSF